MYLIHQRYFILGIVYGAVLVNTVEQEAIHNQSR